MRPACPPLRKRALATAVLWALPWLAAASAAFPAAAADPPNRFTGEPTEVLAVEIPVQVVRDGKPVRGLSAADFTLLEGKAKQQITGFEVVDLGAEPGSPEAPPPFLSSMGRRHFLMLFDLANSEPKAIVKAREAARGVLAKLHRSDLVAVATYSPSQGPVLVLGFTSDRRQTEIALDTLGVPELVDRNGDSLDLVIESLVGTNPGSTPPRVNVDLLNLLLELRDRDHAADRRLQGSRLSDYTRSFTDLGQLMANVDGRKYVVLLSEGFDSSLLIGTDENNAETVNKVETGKFYEVDNDARFGNTRAGNQLERMMEQFRRSDCVIQSVDIGGLREDGARRANGQDALFAMADQTGGELYRNWNDLSDAMGKMLERTSVTYLISFQPQIERDGSYHPIRVELKNAAGARVSHRDGYYAPQPFGERDPLSRRLGTADAIISGKESGDLEATALAVPLRGLAGMSYVPVVLSIDGPSLLRGVETSAAAVLPVEIYAYALGADGTIGDSFGQTVGLDLAKVGDKLRGGGIEFVGHLELAAGDWSIRVLVRNGKTGTLRLRVLPLRVPAFDEGATVFLPPLFPEPIDTTAKAIPLRESPRGTMSESPYPFQLEGQSFVPAAAPVVTAGQAARVVLFAWNLPPSDVRAHALVLSADGREVPGGKIRLVGSENAAGGDLLIATFEPTDLPPGAYRLRVRLNLGDGGEGDETIETDAVPFEVR